MYTSNLKRLPLVTQSEESSMDVTSYLVKHMPNDGFFHYLSITVSSEIIRVFLDGKLVEVKYPPPMAREG